MLSRGWQQRLPTSGHPPILLGSGQASRALSDLGAVPGLLGKARFAFRRLLPPGSFMRAKYPHMHDRALVVLYLRRMAELLRNRPERSDR